MLWCDDDDDDDGGVGLLHTTYLSNLLKSIVCLYISSNIPR